MAADPRSDFLSRARAGFRVTSSPEALAATVGGGEMKRVLKWIGWSLAGLVVLVLAVAAFLYWRGGSFLARKFEVPVETLTLPVDEAALARGGHLATVYCGTCHGEDLGGAMFIEDSAFAILPAPNLTRGRGGMGGALDASGWVRAVRHGVGNDGRALCIMPSEVYVELGREDLAAIVAYLLQAAPVDRELAPRRFGPVGRLLIGAGPLRGAFAVTTIDHEAPIPPTPLPAATAEYGGYLARTFGCAVCHGEALAGGPTAGAPEILSPNLTPGGTLRAWTEGIFIEQARTRQGQHMPWKSLAKMTDEELAALWRFLASLPAHETVVLPE